MKIIYLNVFEGCEEIKRLNRIISFITKENPNILILSEVSGWESNSEEKIKEFKLRTGLKYHFKKKHVLVLSKNRLSNQTHIKDAIIKIKYGINLTIIACHLSPINEDKRLEQIKTLLTNIDINEPTILIGDLNSLSPLDKYNEEEILKKSKELGLAKFGTTKLKKDVQQKILDFGLIDTIKEFSNDFEYSVPTNFNKDYAHLTKLRLDYLYITSSLKKHLKSAKIIRTEETNQLSDHFPIIAEFDS